MRIAFCLMMLTALFWSPVSALALTDLQKFENTVGMSAPSALDSTPPVVCVCKEAGDLLNIAGQLQQGTFTSAGFTFVKVTCQVLLFTGTTLTTHGTCDPWELLPKP